MISGASSAMVNILAATEVPWGTYTPNIDWFHLSPVLIVLGTGVLAVLVEAFVGKRAKRGVHITLAIVALIAAFVMIVFVWQDLGDSNGAYALTSSVGQGLPGLVVDRVALFTQGMLVILGLLSILLMAEKTSANEDAFAPSAASVPGSTYEEQARRKGMQLTEVFPLTMLALGGMMIFPATNDFLTMFIALEVFSLPLYLMCGIARRRRLLSQEASLKYFLLGAFASAIFIFGAALLYGYAGSLKFADIFNATANPGGLDGVFIVGAALVLVGLLFKVGAVPFHSWVPDVYQGAPTPITAFMAACTKTAAVVALLRVLWEAFSLAVWDWRPAIWAVVILTMLVGAILGVVQTDVKRILAYSSIAHAGFILAGVVAIEGTGTGNFSSDGISAALFYLLAYGITSIGAFAVIYLVRERDAQGSITAEATHLTQWVGLGKRAPVLAGTFAFFLLAFAGIPLTSGFTGKFAIFSAAASGGAVWLVVVGVLSSAIALFFYIRIVIVMFFADPPEDEIDRVAVVDSTGWASFVIALSAAVTLVLGVLPGPVLDLAEVAAKFVL